MKDITPKFYNPPSSEIPGGIVNDTESDISVAPSGTMVQPKKDTDVGGMAAGANTLTQGGGDQIYQISPSGIHLGAANFDDAPFRVDMQGNLTAESATLSGSITATSGVIGGFTITPTSMYGGIIKTAATVGVGSTGVIMDTDGLRGYDSVLGKVFDIPTDGSAPEFSSGVISQTTFEINTNAVLRTSATVGDGTANSAGVLINNTGIYATEANQLLADANIRILTDGSGYFSGTFNLGGTSITIDNTQSIQDNLDAIETAGGGTLYLQPGTYTLTSDISIPAGVILQGVSRDGVILDCDGTYKVQITGTNIYNTGTIAISDTDTEVVGTGTTFTSAMVGRYIYLSGVWYEITAFTDTTHIDIGEAYEGTNLSGYATAIADVNFVTFIRRLTITGATGAGLSIQYAMEPTLDDLYIYDNGTGIDADYVQFINMQVTCNENGVNLNMNFVDGFYWNYSEFSYSTTGAGIVMTNSGNAEGKNFSCIGNTGNGISATSCSNFALYSYDISRNGDKGVELISGCNDNQIGIGNVNNNTSDNIKFTATSDRNVIFATSIRSAGGYGINIAASTCDNNQIIAPAFDNNTSGNINDSGTNTVRVENSTTFLDIISLSSADILAIETSPITLVAAPGASKVISVDQVIYSFTYGGTQYTGGDNLRVQYNGDTVALVPTLNNGIINAAASSIHQRSPATSIDMSAGTNKAVELTTQTVTTFATGNGTLKVAIKYSIFNL